MKALALVACAFVVGSCGAPTARVTSIPAAGLSSILVDLKPAKEIKETRQEWRLREAIKAHFKWTYTTRVHLQVEKSVLRPGESIWFHPWVVQSGLLAPASENVILSFYGPDNKIIVESQGKRYYESKDRLRVPITAEAGHYKLVATLDSGETSTRELVVREFGTEAQATTAASAHLANEPSPIDYDEVELKFYPEGGEQVAGLPARMYVAASEGHGRSVPVQGRVLDAKGDVVAEIKTNARGLGRFEYVASKSRLHIVLDKQGHKRHELPLAKDKGCVLLSVDEDDRRADIRMGIWCTRSQRVVVSANLNDEIVGTIATRVRAHKAALVTFSIPNQQPGVVRVTLFDDKPAPLAERLVFRRRDGALQINVTTNRDEYASGDEVQVAIETRDANGKPVNATVSLAVALHASLDETEKSARSLAPALILESQLGGHRIHNPLHFLHESTSAARDLDLLLMTHSGGPFDWQPVLDHIKEWKEYEENAEKKSAELNFREDELESELDKPDGEMTPMWFLRRRRPEVRTTPQAAEPRAPYLGPTNVPLLREKPTQGYQEWEFVVTPRRVAGKPEDRNAVVPDLRTWRRSLTTDARGKGSLRFPAAGAGTRYLISVEGIGDGQIGTATHSFTTKAAALPETPSIGTDDGDAIKPAPGL